MTKETATKGNGVNSYRYALQWNVELGFVWPIVGDIVQQRKSVIELLEDELFGHDKEEWLIVIAVRQ